MMKRKLLPVAIGMAIAGYHSAALSDATVYGKANISAQGNDFQYQGGDQYDNSSFESNASRFGIKGKAKINDDTDAVFKMEYEVFIDDGDDGTDNSSEFNQRNINGGLSSKKWGTLVGGKNDTPLKMAADGTDQFNDLVLGDINNYMVGENRENNIVIYTTPTWKGFTVNVATMFGEEDGVDGTTVIDGGDDDTQDNGMFDRTSIALKYAPTDTLWFALSADQNVQNADIVRFNTQGTFGNLTLNAQIQSAEVSNDNTDEDQFSQEEGEGMAISGSRGLGMVLNDITGSGNTDDNYHQAIESQDAWMVNAKYQWNDWAFKAQYGQSKSDSFDGYVKSIKYNGATLTGGNGLDAGSHEFTAEQLALGVDYAMSKNVTVFAYIAQLEVDVDNAVEMIDDGDLSTGGLGLEVKF